MSVIVVTRYGGHRHYAESGQHWRERHLTECRGVSSWTIDEWARVEGDEAWEPHPLGLTAEQMKALPMCTQCLAIHDEATEAWTSALMSPQPVRYSETFGLPENWPSMQQHCVLGQVADMTMPPVTVMRSWQDRVRIWVAGAVDDVVDDVVRRLVNWIDPDIKTRR